MKAGQRAGTAPNAEPMVATCPSKNRAATAVDTRSPAKEPGTFGKSLGVSSATAKQMSAVPALLRIERIQTDKDFFHIGQEGLVSLYPGQAQEIRDLTAENNDGDAGGKSGGHRTRDKHD